ncbi:hypothetical protein ABFS83_08G006200 [Erythranthe nasuta]
MVLNQEENASCGIIKSDEGCVNVGHLLPENLFGTDPDSDTGEASRNKNDNNSNIFAAFGLLIYDDNEEVDDLSYFGSEKYQKEHVKDCNTEGGASAPADALFFALGYLEVKDLLSVEMVCKSLRDTVRNDPLLWRNIEISYPLSDKITDGDLLRLINRSQGTLSSLSLIRCYKITNTGLKQILERNPRLTKLSVPGCIRLEIEEILRDLKLFNTASSPGIKSLRIGELRGLTNETFEEFKILLGVEKETNPNNHKPRFHRSPQLYLSLDDERVIDIETCPRCQRAKLVYDCPSESCQVEEGGHHPSTTNKPCRGCICCISRCLSCGCCLDDKPYEETFFLEYLCWDCLGQLIDWDMPFHKLASCHFVLCG